VFLRFLLAGYTFKILGVKTHNNYNNYNNNYYYYYYNYNYNNYYNYNYNDNDNDNDNKHAYAGTNDCTRSLVWKLSAPCLVLVPIWGTENLGNSKETEF
jgi:hypothetical protein